MTGAIESTGEGEGAPILGGKPEYIQSVTHPPGLIGMIRIQEDWTGLTSPAERRKLQNRINQRAYRKRTAKSRGGSVPKSVSPEAKNRNKNEEPCAAGSIGHSVTKMEYQTELWRVFSSAVGTPKLDCSELGQAAKVCGLSSAEGQKLISEFEKWAQSRLTMGSPNADHLLVFVKINVFRALISNSKDLGFNHEENMPDDALSPFSDPSGQHRCHQTLPLALRPTKMQCEIPHHPWLDLIPIPGMRDNLIRAGDSYDDMELCGDLVGCFSDSSNREGMIVWGDPWDPNSWEVTESFLCHWGWTVKGCRELLASTNRWRQRRGENPLNFLRVCQ